MILNSHLRPPGGYTFTDSDGTSHTGSSWPHLVRLVAQHRALTGMLPGDPAREITAVVCMRDPRLCSAGGRDPLHRVDKEAFYLRVIGWMLKLTETVRRKAVKYVDGITARDRAEICRGCPFQNGWEKDCSSCRESTRAVHRQLIGDRENFGKGLLGCLILSEDTSVSVHLDAEKVSNPNLPERCWRRAK